MGGRGSGSYTAGSATVGASSGGGGSGTDMNIAGWTPQAGKKSVSKSVTIKSANKRIAGLDHEQMVIVGQDGYVRAAVKGDKHSVGLTPNAERHIKGNDVLHNHPNGTALSPADVITAGNTGARSISAVSRRSGKTYVLTATSKANGKGLSRQMKRDEKALINKWQAKADSMTGKKYKNKQSYENQLYKHWDNILGDWMQQNAAKYGYTYKVSK